jgi:ketosteroid isomerase-like protein
MDQLQGSNILNSSAERAVTTREKRSRLFSKLQDPATQPDFWTQVADDVDWTVEGTHPLAGRYHSKSKFVASTFSRLAHVLPGGVKLVVQRLYVDGDTAIVEFHSTSTTNEGAQFANDYCWVCRFEGDIIVEVRAYLDSMMVTYTIMRNEIDLANS